jgi:hypothetical protein
VIGSAEPGEPERLTWILASSLIQWRGCGLPMEQ